MESQAKHKIVEDGPGKKDYLSVFVNILTVIASILTIAPFMAAFLCSNQQISASVLTPAPLAPPITPVATPAYVTPTDMSQPCILESTSYSAEVSGYLARVTVKQRFRNPNQHKLSATYVFPLSDRSAVDDMTMQIGERSIKGQIKESEEARRIYAQAQAAGQTATLLEQVRTNIFSQSVANIEPGKPIDVTIKYTETLPFSEGQYSLVFPSKVGPRFIPAGCQGKIASLNSWGSVGNDKSSVNVHVCLNEGGIPIKKIFSPSHSFQIVPADPSHASMSYASSNADSKDLVISWQMAAGEVQSGYLAHKEGKDGFVTAMILPPNKVSQEDAAPKEMIFIMDCSGSQSGAPIEKAKDTLNYIVEHMNPKDTFQIISFSNTVRTFPEVPVHVSGHVKGEAHAFINQLQADGGTIMAAAIEAACKIPAKENRLRIVTLMTDGYIGNDYEIIGMVKRLRGSSRWFPFGTGDSVNRTLIDGVAKEGGGEPDYVLLNASSQDVAERFYKRIANPVLTDVKVSSEGIELTDIYPNKPSDVWEQRPLYFTARYKNSGSGYLVVKGFSQGKPYTQKLPIVLPAQETANASIPQTWAHDRIDQLMALDWNGMQSGAAEPEIKKEIINTSLAYHVLSQFTSFVAVDSSFSQKDIERLISEENAKARSQAAAQNAAAASASTSNSNQATVLPTLSPDFGLQHAISQSFSTITNQCNRLNSVTNIGTGGSGSYSQSGNAGSPESNSSSVSWFSSGGPDAFDGTAATNNNTGNYTGNYTGSQTQQGGSTSAPMLQGATNGAIGPQGCDATVIQGVNTTATVRVSNLTFVENLAALAQYAWLLSAGILLFALTLNKKLAAPGTRKRLWMSCICFALIALNLPNTVGWILQSARDTNLL